MTAKSVQCLPSFSEGRDETKIKAIAGAGEGVPGAKILHVDPRPGANRTVITFVGTPEAAAEAAFRAIARAAEVIDMREHHGEHPRLGATDVCPFVPVEGVTLAECAAIARRVGRRVGDELGIPVYFYEATASDLSRTNLADILRGEYEGLGRGDVADRRFCSVGLTAASAENSLDGPQILTITGPEETAVLVGVEPKVTRSSSANWPFGSPFSASARNNCPCGSRRRGA